MIDDSSSSTNSLSVNENNFNSLNELVADKSDVTIKLDKNYTYSGDDDITGISISGNNLIINGTSSKFTINAMNKSSFISVTGTNVTLTNIKFINNIDIIIAPGADLKLISCVFNGSSVTNEGTLNLSKNSLSSQYLIYNAGDIVSQAKVTLTNVESKAGEQATVTAILKDDYGYGYIVDENFIINIDGVDYKTDYADKQYQAIVDTSKLSALVNPINVKDDKLKNISASSANLTLVSDIIYVSNDGDDSNIGSIDSPVKTLNQGLLLVKTNGTIIMKEGTYEFDSLTVNKDVTIKSDGGKTILTSPDSSSASKFMSIAANVTISDLSIDKVSSYWVFEVKKTLNLDNVSFTNSHSSIPINVPVNGILNIKNSIFENNVGTKNGVIYSLGHVNIDESIFLSNGCDSATGGAIAVASTSIVKNQTLYLDNVYFLDNAAKNGGAIYVQGYSSKKILVDIKSSYFGGNSAIIGGALYLNAVNLSIRDSKFIDNIVDDDEGYGGSIFITSSEAIMDYLTFDHSSALAGGFIHSQTLTNISLSNSNFNDGISSKSGGAINFCTGDYVVTNCNFTNCSSFSGGVVDISHDGVGAYNYTFENCIFEDNEASNHGGVLLAVLTGEDKVTFTNSKFISNIAKEGGVIYCIGSGINLNNCILEDNVAEKANVIFSDVKENLNDNYWAMNYTTIDEFKDADLISISGESSNPDNWILMSIYAPENISVLTPSNLEIKFDKSCDGESISEFSGLLPDYDAKILVNGSEAVNVSIKDSEGVYELIVDTVGDYAITVVSPITGDEEARLDINAIKLSTKFDNVSSGTIYNGNYFKLTLKDANGKILASKEVKITLLGKTYTVTTDANGVAKVKIAATNSQIGKDLKVTYKFAGDETYVSSSGSTTIKVAKTATKITKITKGAVKNHGNFYVKLTTKSGKALANKVITMKSKNSGKTYKIKTNSKGIAKTDLWVKVKPKGKYYSFKFKYAGSAYYNAYAVTFKVKLV